MVVRITCLVAVAYIICLKCVFGGVINDSNKETYDTIVVGCGVSGLAAVSELSRCGKRAVCLEAADRIGGRVRTVEFGDGIVELGAEWIHGTEGSKTYQLAVTNNVSVVPQNQPIHYYRSNIGAFDKKTEEELSALVEYTIELLDEPVEDEEGLGSFIMRKCNEYMEKKFPDLYNNKTLVKELYENLNEVVNSYEATNDWNEASAKTSSKSLGGNPNMSWGRKGYRTLFDIILNKYNGGEGVSAAVMVNKEVMNIAWSDEEVVVKCRDGSQYSAPHVIITTSVGVLKERHADLFTPSLPHEKLAAIEAIPMGLEGKIVLAFDSKWLSDEKSANQTSGYSLLWREEDKKQVPKEDKWMTRVAVISNSMGSDNTLVFWVMGDAAKKVESLPVETVKAKATEILRTFLGKETTVPEPSDIIKTSWFSNPWTRGSYTYDGIGMSPTSRADLASPVMDSKGNFRILFAGEATNPTHFATVHGAYESGIREAHRLIGDNLNNCWSTQL